VESEGTSACENGETGLDEGADGIMRDEFGRGGEGLERLLLPSRLADSAG
jgi:hypothetical protein